MGRLCGDPRIFIYIYLDVIPNRAESPVRNLLSGSNFNSEIKRPRL
jgi:hypothetical protein